MKSNIVLIGMPGSGKTTIGRILADRLCYHFIDTDELIEKKQQKKIKELFIDGEGYFRTIEKQAVKEVSKRFKTIISTGGGVIKDADNIKDLKENGLIIFIDRPKSLILNDIKKENRPLLNNSQDIERLFMERYNLYKKYADSIVLNASSIDNVLDEIILIIQGVIK